MRVFIRHLRHRPSVALVAFISALGLVTFLGAPSTWETYLQNNALSPIDIATCAVCESTTPPGKALCSSNLANNEVVGPICLNIYNQFRERMNGWTESQQKDFQQNLKKRFGEGCDEYNVSLLAGSIEHFLISSLGNNSTDYQTSLTLLPKEVFSSLLSELETLLPRKSGLDSVDKLYSFLTSVSKEPVCVPRIAVQSSTSSTLGQPGKNTDKTSDSSKTYTFRTASLSASSETQKSAPLTAQDTACEGKEVGTVCDPLTGATCQGTGRCPSGHGIQLAKNVTLFGNSCESGEAENPNPTSPDLPKVPGDVNGDGVFNSSDLVVVFAAGKYNTGEDASYYEGDWNGDGVFDSADFVYVLQQGTS